MPVWELEPIDPDDFNWRASTYKGRVVIRAPDEDRAREIAILAFAIGTRRELHEGVPFCPWDHEDKVRCRQLTDPRYPEDGPEEILERPLSTTTSGVVDQYG